ncbi:MAG: hypothetical protein L0229_29700 [Blastocatellia bacterium]|nr:hypothetical protein [Blastocatellia bacterium]
MKRTIPFLIIALLSAIALGLLMSGFSGTGAQVLKPGDRGTQAPKDNPAHGILHLANHHQELSFNITVGEPISIPLPVKDRPVRIEVVINSRPLNAVSQFPILMAGLVVQDSITGGARVIGDARFDPGGDCFDLPPGTFTELFRLIDSDIAGAELPNGDRLSCGLGAFLVFTNGEFQIHTEAISLIQHGDTPVFVSMWY